MMSTYGFCPQCGAPGVSRERRPNGNDTCANGHIYSSKESLNSAEYKGVFEIVVDREVKIELTKTYPSKRSEVQNFHLQKGDILKLDWASVMYREDVPVYADHDETIVIRSKR